MNILNKVKRQKIKEKIIGIFSWGFLLSFRRVEYNNNKKKPKVLKKHACIPAKKKYKKKTV